MKETQSAATGRRGDLSPAEAPRYREAGFGITEGRLREGADGVRYLTATTGLEHYPHRMTDRLLHWAEVAPDRTFLAQRERLPDGSRGDWIRISYGEMLKRARATVRGT